MDWTVFTLGLAAIAFVAFNIYCAVRSYNRGHKLLFLIGIFVPVAETVESFEALVNGDLDHVPEQAFFNVGGVESVLAKAKTLEG